MCSVGEDVQDADTWGERKDSDTDAVEGGDEGHLIMEFGFNSDIHGVDCFSVHLRDNLLD
jgi:hypothetical protein